MTELHGPSGAVFPMASTTGLRTLRARTRFASIDQFVTSFAPFVDEGSVFVATDSPLEAGAKRQFVFQLADGTAVLQGRGTVAETVAGDVRMSGRSGMRIDIVELTPRSREVHRALLAAQASAAGKSHPNTVPRAPRLPLPPRLPPPIPKAPPSPGPPPSWDSDVTRPDVTRPGDPSELEMLMAADRAAARQETASTALPPSPAPSTSPTSPAEERTPGAAETLPANPLAEMDDVALDSFVEFTLHEDDGPFPEHREVDLDPAMPGGIRRRLTRTRVAVALAAAVGLVGGYALGGGFATSSPDVVPAPPSTVAASLTPPEAAGLAVENGETPPAPAALAVPDDPVASCRGEVRTVPEGISVRWGDTVLGDTPLTDVPVPCGESQVVLAHQRYERVDRAVVAHPGEPVVIDVRMARPAGRLSLRSVPATATFTVDGVAVGRGATTATVRAFAHVEVTATAPGYKPWSQRVYVAGRSATVTAELEKRPRASQAPRPGRAVQRPAATRP